MTGGSGFIESHIVRALVERGDAVVSFDARPHLVYSVSGGSCIFSSIGVLPRVQYEPVDVHHMQWPIYIKPMVENSVRGSLPGSSGGGSSHGTIRTSRTSSRSRSVRWTCPQASCRTGSSTQRPAAPSSPQDRWRRLSGRSFPGADIEIGSGLSEEDLVEIRYRGVLSIENARTQLGYEPRYADIREGIAEYIATYRRYLEETEG